MKHPHPLHRGPRLVALVAFVAWAIVGADARGRQPAPRSVAAPVTAASGMVASAHPLASQAGLEMLRAGGNAVDAAVAAAFAIGVVEPNASGLGGEGLMVIYLAASRRAVAIDYRSVAPAAATPEMDVPDAGYAAVAVPGTVAGLTTALSRYGRLRLGKVMAPSIRLAERGFVVSPTLAAVVADNFEPISASPGLSALFCPDGLPVEPGMTLRNPDLARTLRAIAAGGAEAFYRGALADRIAAAAAAGGGLITTKDLADYRAIERPPVRGRYRGYDIVSAPPPMGGLAVVEILQILEHRELTGVPHFSPAHVHLLSEAMKRGFADFNAYAGDPAFVRVPVAELLSPEYVKARAAEIDPARVTPKVSPGPIRQESSSTTALSTVDRQGNMVAVTQTISEFFGAKVVVDGTGIILNNEMRNFSARGPNVLVPGKRPRTAGAPTIVLHDGRPFATIGTPGAGRIISTMALLLSNLIDYDMDIQQAIEAPRFYARDNEPKLAIEGRVTDATAKTLASMGYVIEMYEPFDLFFGGAQGIVVDPRTGKRQGGADPRRDGAVVGY